MKLKIGTYNICHCCDYEQFAPTYERQPKVVNIEKIASVIKSLNLDVVGLNEVFDFGTDGYQPFIHQTEKIAKLAGYKYYYYSQGHDYGWTDIGNAILSRHPLKNIQSFKIATLPEDKRTENVWHEDRTIIWADAIINDSTISFLVTHYGLAEYELQAITNKVCEIIDNSSSPIILMGDLNVQPDNKFLVPLDKRLKSCARCMNNNEYTYSSYNPEIHIDYIFVPKNAKVLDYKVHKVIASDHFPIYAKIEL